MRGVYCTMHKKKGKKKKKRRKERKSQSVNKHHTPCFASLSAAPLAHFSIWQNEVSIDKFNLQTSIRVGNNPKGSPCFCHPV